MDVNALKVKLDKIVIPGSDKTIGEQARLLAIDFKDETLSIRYKRDGIELKNKKLLEDAIYDTLMAEDFSEDQIRLMAVSDGPTEKKQSETPASSKKPQEASAGLKTGHGPAGQNKKRVPGAKKVIAISSGKGGVGKSTVAVNLALSLKNQGFKIGLIDADIYGPSIPTLLGQREAKPKANDDKKIMPVEAHGISFISFGLFISEKDPVIWRGPMLGGVLNQFLFDVQWGDLDFLIIDLPPGTGDMQLSMIQATEVDSALVVSTPQQVALLDSQKGLEMFRQVNVPVMGMVENMSYFAPDDDQTKRYYLFGQGGVSKACETLGVDLLGEIPMEIALRESCDEGHPYMANPAYEGREVWKAYSELALKVSAKMGLRPNEKGEQSKGFFKKLFS